MTQTPQTPQMAQMAQMPQMAQITQMADGREAFPMSSVVTTSDSARLERLNADYIEAVKTSDVGRFSQLLAEDFLCSLPDGSLIDRTVFLEQAAKPYTLRSLEAHDVVVRVLGDTALVHGRTTFTTADGRPGMGRYTDVWARRDDHWVAVAAHVTRL